MKKYKKTGRAILIISLLLAFAVANGQDEVKALLPVVVSASTPIYPIGPHTVNIQGTTKVRIITDGLSVAKAILEDDGGHPSLGRAAVENARTWKFAKHSPTSFSVTYRYSLMARIPDLEPGTINSKVILRFPNKIEIFAQKWPVEINAPAEVKDEK